MQNFANQCLDMAKAILEHNLDSIREDGSISPVNGEFSLPEEPGHAALAIGEYYRATQEPKLGKYDLIDLVAKCITKQADTEDHEENGLAYVSLGLLSFGPSKDRNPVWDKLSEATRETLDRRLLARTDYTNHFQAFNIAKAVARFSMGLSKKDETGKLIDKFLERIDQNSSIKFFDNDWSTEPQIKGTFDIYGLLSFIFIRQALQLHSNIHLRDRKLPSLRTYAEKYIKLIPDLTRSDGLGFAYGKDIGAYGQMNCISLILQAMRDGWITDDQKPLYYDVMRRLFQFFFVSYLDQEHGFLVIRDHERTMADSHSTRLANFDAARYLCQWARLSKAVGTVQVKPSLTKTTGKFISFDKSSKKEQGVFVYHDSKSGLHLQLPLCASGSTRNSSNYLAFPHSPGVFDWPADLYLPILLPELTFGDKVVIPSFYGKNCVTGLGLRNSFYFRYEQPELITKDEIMASGLGSCKVNWTFSGDKITSEFIFTVKAPIQLDKMRYVIALAAPHSQYRIGTSLMLGEESLRVSVVRDDFHAHWEETTIVSEDPQYSSFYGKIHFLQILSRDHALLMKPGQQYNLTLTFHPDLKMVDE